MIFNNEFAVGNIFPVFAERRISVNIGTLAMTVHCTLYSLSVKHMPKVKNAWYTKYWIDILGPSFNSALWLCCLVLHSHNILIGNYTHWYTSASIQHFSLRCPLSSACIHLYCMPIRLKSMVIKITVQVSNALGRRVILLILCFCPCFCFILAGFFLLLICILWLFATDGNCIKLTANACLSEQWALHMWPHLIPFHAKCWLWMDSVFVSRAFVFHANNLASENFGNISII